jgi:hypothetical protein
MSTQHIIDYFTQTFHQRVQRKCTSLRPTLRRNDHRYPCIKALATRLEEIRQPAYYHLCLSKRDFQRVCKDFYDRVRTDRAFRYVSLTLGSKPSMQSAVSVSFNEADLRTWLIEQASQLAGVHINAKEDLFQQGFDRYHNFLQLRVTILTYSQSLCSCSRAPHSFCIGVQR